jgi:hypothetical protein
MSYPNYTCVRCGMNTNNKQSMRTHLYKRKQICPFVENDIELTDEVKECILLNRVYKIKSEPNIINDKNQDQDQKTNDQETDYDLSEYKLLSPYIKTIFNNLKESQLDDYEKYLIRNLESDQNNPQKYKEHLEIYYNSIIPFEIQPFVYDQCSCNILNKKDCICNNSDFDLSKKYMKFYQELKMNMKRNENNKTIRHIVEMIKKNHKERMKELATAIFDTFLL